MQEKVWFGFRQFLWIFNSKANIRKVFGGVYKLRRAKILIFESPHAHLLNFSVIFETKSFMHYVIYGRNSFTLQIRSTPCFSGAYQYDLKSKIVFKEVKICWLPFSENKPEESKKIFELMCAIMLNFLSNIFLYCGKNKKSSIHKLFFCFSRFEFPSCVCLADGVQNEFWINIGK